MEAHSRIFRTPVDRGRPSYLVPEPRYSHRQARPHRVQIYDLAAGRAARKDGLAVLPITGDLPTSFGYPMRMPLRIVTSSELRDALVTRLPPIVFRKAEAVRDPRFVDYVVAMLHLDPIAARAMVERNRELVDDVYLLKRVVQEDLEEPATALRFQDFAPAIPLVGAAAPRPAIERQMDKNRTRTVIP